MKKKPAYNQEWLDMEMKRRLAETPTRHCKSGDDMPAEIPAIMQSTYPDIEKATHIFIQQDDGTIEWQIKVADELICAQVREPNSFLPYIREEVWDSPTEIVIYEFSK